MLPPTTTMPQVNIHWTKNRPSRTAAPRAWEKTWESDFSRNMYIYESFPGSIVDHVPTDLAVAGSQGNNAAVLAGEIAQVCKLQQGLAQMMLVVFPGGTIESQWRALSRARREEVVLAGILRTFRNDWMEDRRQWCPETTLRNLTSRNGEEFLTIVHALKPARADILPTEPLHLPHATIDRIFTPTADDLQKPGCDSVIATFKMVRTYTITATIWNVLHELVSYISLRERMCGLLNFVVGRRKLFARRESRCAYECHSTYARRPVSHRAGTTSKPARTWYYVHILHGGSGISG